MSGNCASSVNFRSVYLVSKRGLNFSSMGSHHQNRARHELVFLVHVSFHRRDFSVWNPSDRAPPLSGYRAASKASSWKSKLSNPSQACS